MLKLSTITICTKLITLQSASLHDVVGLFYFFACNIFVCICKSNLMELLLTNILVLQYATFKRILRQAFKQT